MECPVCDALKRTCKELGDEGFCAALIDDLKQDKITEVELADRITARFGKEKFGGAWDKTAETVQAEPLLL